MCGRMGAPLAAGTSLVLCPVWGGGSCVGPSAPPLPVESVEGVEGTRKAPGVAGPTETRQRGAVHPAAFRAGGRPPLEGQRVMGPPPGGSLIAQKSIQGQPSSRFTSINKCVDPWLCNSKILILFFFSPSSSLFNSLGQPLPPHPQPTHSGRHTPSPPPHHT